jgi:NitT/TauT family transport system substrate-binding protein
MEINKQKPIGPFIKYADHGVNIYSGGFVVTKATAAGKSKMLRGFLAATAKSYEEGLRDPQAATDALIAARPASDRELMAAQTKYIPSYLHTKNSEGHGFGWMAKQDWAQTIELLTKYFDLPAGTDPSTLYTNEFLPKS